MAELSIITIQERLDFLYTATGKYSKIFTVEYKYIIVLCNIR